MKKRLSSRRKSRLGLANNNKGEDKVISIKGTMEPKEVAEEEAAITGKTDRMMLIVSFISGERKDTESHQSK